MTEHPQSEADDIEALVLETSPRKWAWICLGCIGFVLVGMVVVVAGYVVAGLAGALVSVVWNYAASATFVWRRRRTG